MSTKAELIERMEALLQNPDVEHVQEHVDALKESYEALVAATQQEAPQEAAVAVEAGSEGSAPAPELPAQPIESAPLLDEEDKKFKQLLDAFNTKVNDLRRQRQKQETDNLAAKTAIMDELKAMITSEENISNAFQRFNELGEKWKTIGPVPQQNYRDLQRDYSHLRDEFFYHIRIYKELRDHDLKKNTALKQALIADMQAVQHVESVKEAEALVKEYQEKWHQIGAVVKEEWEPIRDGFWNATRVVYDRINEYYRARRAEHDANLFAKQALIEKVNAVVAEAEAKSAKDWKALTDQVLELQTAWKSVGFATKKDNERVWKEFRNACNAFFDKKNAFFSEMKSQFKGAFDKKQALLQQAIQLKDSTDWRQTADKLKALQAQWKEAGSAGPRDENKLWNKFRESCDAFFQNRKTHFDALDAEQAVHVQEKEQLLSELENFQHLPDRGATLDTLKAFSTRWMNSGRVSPKMFDAMANRYRTAMDKQYGLLRLNAEEKRRMAFVGRVEEIKSSADPKFQLDKEARFVKRKIEEIETEMKQMDRNMGMFNFKSASGEAMKKDMEKKIEKARQDVERLKKQHRQLMQEMRGPVAPKAESAAPVEVPQEAPPTAPEPAPAPEPPADAAPDPA
ncbi:MAG: DUF349 domain-containing protein [Flavobacteriales bacterium]|nr:DUF349 domain-containing protein [Flavobacteriales bacterium]